MPLCPNKTLSAPQAEASQQQRAIAWLEAMISRELASKVDVLAALRDGEALCDLANVLTPGSIAKVHRDTQQPFKHLENVQKFLQMCRSAEVPFVIESCDLNGTADAAAVLKCLAAVSKRFRTSPAFEIVETQRGKLAGFEAPELSESPASTELSDAERAPGLRPSRSFIDICEEEYGDLPRYARRRREPRREEPPPASSQRVLVRDNCVVHWPHQRPGDERFETIVASLPDDEFKAQVADLQTGPGAKLRLQYRPKSGCVLESEDAEGNCCQLELDWGP